MVEQSMQMAKCHSSCSVHLRLPLWVKGAEQHLHIIVEGQGALFRWREARVSDVGELLAVWDLFRGQEVDFEHVGAAFAYALLRRRLMGVLPGRRFG